MKKKTVMIISVLAVLVLAVGGILAYLTDTASVTNTFTVGNVDITLDEADVDENGELIIDETTGDPVERVVENKYHLIPGMTYIKDPTMTVVKGSEESYVRMMVKITKLKEFDAIFAPDKADLTKLFNDYEAANWIYVGEVRNEADDANYITYEFRYKEPVKAEKDANKKLEPLFKSITVPGSMTKEQLATVADFNIVVTGHAIQVAGFEAELTDGMTDDQIKAAKKAAEDKAWAAFDAEMPK